MAQARQTTGTSIAPQGVSLESIIEQLRGLQAAISDGEGASVLRDRIEGMVDQLSAIRSREEGLRAEVELLQAEIARVSAERDELALKYLQGQLQGAKEPGDPLEENAERILEFYSDRKDSAAIGWVAKTLGIPSAEGQIHANDLSRRGFLALVGFGGTAVYTVSPEGEKYVLKYLR